MGCITHPDITTFFPVAGTKTIGHGSGRIGIDIAVAVKIGVEVTEITVFGFRAIVNPGQHRTGKLQRLSWTSTGQHTITTVIENLRTIISRGCGRSSSPCDITIIITKSGPNNAGSIDAGRLNHMMTAVKVIIAQMTHETINFEYTGFAPIHLLYFIFITVTVDIKDIDKVIKSSIVCICIGFCWLWSDTIGSSQVIKSISCIEITQRDPIIKVFSGDIFSPATPGMTLGTVHYITRN